MEMQRYDVWDATRWIGIEDAIEAGMLGANPKDGELCAYADAIERERVLREALDAAHEAAELGGWEDCPEDDNCPCCDAWRKARQLRDAALAQ